VTGGPAAGGTAVQPPPGPDRAGWGAGRSRDRPILVDRAVARGPACFSTRGPACERLRDRMDDRPVDREVSQGTVPPRVSTRRLDQGPGGCIGVVPGRCGGPRAPGPAHGTGVARLDRQADRVRPVEGLPYGRAHRADVTESTSPELRTRTTLRPGAGGRRSHRRRRVCPTRGAAGPSDGGRLRIESGADLQCCLRRKIIT